MIFLSFVALLFAAIPATMVFINRRLFLPPTMSSTTSATNSTAGMRPQVSVLIPARNEAQSIGPCIRAVLENVEVEIEVIVLDDASTDETADIVMGLATQSPNIKCLSGTPLPSGWNGKQHACWQLAGYASHPLLLFIDADVRLSPDSIARLVRQKEISESSLLSAFPFQETETFWEKLLIPMMHFVLLGFLPIQRMREKQFDPSLAAGCGQLFLTSQVDYRRAGTHEAIRSSRHDGLKLPRAYRAAGLSTDICDGTSIARCRMYHNANEVWNGLMKNAVEGIANPKLIVPFTLLLFCGSVLPGLLLLFMIGSTWSILDQSSSTTASTDSSIHSAFCIAVLFAAAIASWIPRWWCARQFQQSKLGALLHPLAVLAFLCIQWAALLNYVRGHRTAWRGRTES